MCIFSSFVLDATSAFYFINIPQLIRPFIPFLMDIKVICNIAEDVLSIYF